MTDTQTTVSQDTRPEHRRGCSCFSIILYGIFLLVALAALGLYGLQHYIRKHTFSGMSPTEIAEYNTWANTEVQIPVHLETPPPTLPESFYKEKKQFFTGASKFFQTEGKVFYEGRSSLAERLLNGGFISFDELTTLSEFGRRTQKYAEQAKALADYPDYVINDRRSVGIWNGYLDLSKSFRLLHLHALDKIYREDYRGALDEIDTMLKLTRRDPLADIINHMTASGTFGTLGRDMTMLVATRTTDPEVLRQSVEVLTRNRNIVFAPDEDYVFMGDYLPQRIQMIADGYPDAERGTTTPFNLIYTYSQREDYYQWLNTNLPAGDPRLPAVRTHLASIRSAKASATGVGVWVNKLAVGPLKTPFQYVSNMWQDMWGVQIWKTHRQLRERIRTLMAKYDLTIVHIARKLAQAEGAASLLTDPAQFAPKYMTAFPNDPFTSSPFVYDSTSDVFLSTGPDAKPFTADDVFADIPYAATLDKDKNIFGNVAAIATTRVTTSTAAGAVGTATTAPLQP